MKRNMGMKKFKRPKRATNKKDETGKIRVIIYLIDEATSHNSHKKGNISRSFSVADAKVSEVADCIENALFGEKDV